MRLRREYGQMRELIPHASRYVVSALVVGVAYLGLPLLLSGPGGLPLQAVIPVALVIACVLHYLLQRHFVFADRATYTLSAGRQAQAYVPIVLAQYCVIAASTGALPSLLHADEQLVYAATVCVVSAATFLILRSYVFHGE